ncbi:MAG: hypothetical protein U1E65_30640 [Myxococcota bacterium]
MSGGIDTLGYNTYFSALFQRSLSSGPAYLQNPANVESLARAYGGDRDGYQVRPFHYAETTIGYAAMPDFQNAGNLSVDKQKGVVTTPGGFNVAVADGHVRIQNPDGKWTDLKAEPPERTLISSTTGTETRKTDTVEQVLRRDPAVRESDGDVWRYSGAGTFNLPDGTKIKVQEDGEGKDLHISQVDVINGNKHVSIDSKLTNAEYQTYQRDVKQDATNWQTTGTERQWQNSGRTSALHRFDTQQREVTTTTTEHQRANQQFQTTFSDVNRDGYFTDARLGNGQTFNLAGNGAAWSQGGREVVSGAGKGLDDKTKAYQLGGGIDQATIGARPVDVPWNVYAFAETKRIDGAFFDRYHQHHCWGDQPRWYGESRDPRESFISMQSSVSQLFSVYQGSGALESEYAFRRYAARLMV